MPIYEYACDACGKKTEVIQGMNEKPLKVCPHCGEKKLKKLMSAPAIQFKGSGFYITDYASGDRKSGGKKAEGEKSEGAGKAEKADKAEKSESAGKSEKVEKKADKKKKSAD
jgi:putative FmdB family regulatory protein